MQIISIKTATGKPLEPLQRLDLEWQCEVAARILTQLIRPAELPNVIQGNVSACNDMPGRLAAIIRLAEEQLAEMQAVNNG